MKRIFTILMFAFSLTVYSQQLIADTLFGNNGQVSTAGAGASETNRILPQPDNKVILCGNTYDANCNCYYNDMLRVDACGNIDSAFGVNGYVHHTFDQRNIGNYYELQPDGKILVSGVQSDGNAGSQQFPFIARYKSDGSVDSTFGSNGTNKINCLGPGNFTSIYLMDSGKILCTGSPNGNSNLIMRFDSTGAIDNTFGNNGKIQHSIPPGVNFFYDSKSIMRNDGKIVSVAPAYLGFNNDKNVVLSCFDTLGVIDSSFGVNGFFIDYNFVIGNGLRLELQSDDKIIVAQQNLPETAIIIARYNANGSLDTTYGVNGYINIPAPNSPSRLQFLTKFNDDKILIGYQENGVVPVFKKFDINGVEDTNFSLNGINSFQFTNLNKSSSAIVADNDELLIGGSQNAFSIARFILSYSVPIITQSGNTLFSNVSNSGATFHWFFNGNAITDSTGSSLTASQNGTYSVIVTNSWGCEQSDEFVVSNIVSGIQESLVDILSVYPNPASTVLHIIWNDNKNNTTVELLDMTGRIVFGQNISEQNQTDLNIPQLAKGMYLLKVSSASFSHTKRISIE